MCQLLQVDQVRKVFIMRHPAHLCHMVSCELIEEPGVHTAKHHVSCASSFIESEISRLLKALTLTWAFKPMKSSLNYKE
jgi:hypothetical protein